MKYIIMGCSILALVFLWGCSESETHNYRIDSVQEQTFQLRLDRACTEHKHFRPTIHQQTFDGMKHYAFSGEEWNETGTMEYYYIHETANESKVVSINGIKFLRDKVILGYKILAWDNSETDRYWYPYPDVPSEDNIMSIFQYPFTRLLIYWEKA